MKKIILLFGIFMLGLGNIAFAANFEDVSKNDWYYEAVKYVSENKILNGTSETTFSPLGNITRAMIVQALYNMEGQPKVNAKNTYKDVTNGKWYEKAIIWSTSNKIVSGTGDNKFSPDAYITKEQMITILYNFAKYKKYDVSVGENTNILSYEDSFSIAEYAYMPFQWACGAGVTGEGKSLEPKRQLVRAEVAEIMMNFSKAYSSPTADATWIELNGIAISDYAWRVIECDNSIIKVSNYEYIKPETTGQMGKFKFKITPINSGKTKLVFEYSTLLVEEPPVDTVEFNVEVDADKNIQILR